MGKMSMQELCTLPIGTQFLGKNGNWRGEVVDRGGVKAVVTAAGGYVYRQGDPEPQSSLDVTLDASLGQEGIWERVETIMDDPEPFNHAGFVVIDSTGALAAEAERQEDTLDAPPRQREAQDRRLSSKQAFLAKVQSIVSHSMRLIVLAVQLPNGAIEVITNTSGFADKVDYLVSAYDDDFRLKANPQVQIVGWMVV